MYWMFRWLINANSDSLNGNGRSCKCEGFLFRKIPRICVIVHAVCDKSIASHVLPGGWMTSQLTGKRLSSLVKKLPMCKYIIADNACPDIIMRTTCDITITQIRNNSVMHDVVVDKIASLVPLRPS